MIVREDRREAAVERMADHVLAEGLAAATLRPLAAAAGTSDRMLLYYFADKEELLRATLERIAARMIAQLDAAVPSQPRKPFAQLLEEVRTAMGAPSLQPFMPLWLDLASGAARGLRPHREIAGDIADGFLAWVTVRLELDGNGEASPSAPLFLVLIEGTYLLQAVDRGGLAEAALGTLLRREG